jgi:hypothetical protein
MDHVFDREGYRAMQEEFRRFDELQASMQIMWAKSAHLMPDPKEIAARHPGLALLYPEMFQ